MNIILFVYVDSLLYTITNTVGTYVKLHVLFIKVHLVK